MKFTGIIMFCSSVLFVTFTFVTAKTNFQADNWATFGWPAIFLKRFDGDDFFLGTDYFYFDRLVLDILVCTAISLLLVMATLLVPFKRARKKLAHH